MGSVTTKAANKTFSRGLASSTLLEVPLVSTGPELQVGASDGSLLRSSLGAVILHSLVSPLQCLGSDGAVGGRSSWPAQPGRLGQGRSGAQQDSLLLRRR